MHAHYYIIIKIPVPDVGYLISSVCSVVSERTPKHYEMLLFLLLLFAHHGLRVVRLEGKALLLKKQPNLITGCVETKLTLTGKFFPCWLVL